MQDIINWDELTSSKKTRHNAKVKLTEEDIKAKARIYCKESYAQELYEMMTSHSLTTNSSLSPCKDLEEGKVYDVVATQISFDDSFIKTYEKNSKTEIVVPFKEFNESIDALAKGEGLKFKVMITRVSGSGQFLGSQRKCISIIHKEELFQHLEDNTWFKVKVKKLIRGGYIALYKNDIECFIPGSHARANVISNFDDLLGKEMNIMVDNYDRTNDLFILSYKKYIKESMSTMISELKFGKHYRGKLTNKPYDFGMFVEIDEYYTGLIHSSDFDDYNEIKKFYKAGDEIDVYIKDVIRKKGEYRILLTVDPDSIDDEKKKWDILRDRTEGNSFDYEVNVENNSISIYVDGDTFDVTLRRKDLEANLDNFPKVKVIKVDPINKNLKFEFVED